MSLEDFRQKRAAEKRAAILDAAEESFRADGYTRTSMEHVAGAARVSTATLYRHFKGKAELFAAVAERTIHSMTLAATPAADPIKGLFEISRAYARLLSQPDTLGLFRMLVAETGRDHELAERFYGAVKSQISDLFATRISDAVKAAALKPIDDLDSAAGQLRGMIEHGTLLRGLILGDDAGNAREAEAIADGAVKAWLSHWQN